MVSAEIFRKLLHEYREFDEQLLSVPFCLFSAKFVLEEERRLPQTQIAGKRCCLLFVSISSSFISAPFYLRPLAADYSALLHTKPWKLLLNSWKCQYLLAWLESICYFMNFVGTRELIYVCAAPHAALPPPLCPGSSVCVHSLKPCCTTA